MKFRTLLLAVPFLAACESGDVLAPSAASFQGDAKAPFSYNAPITAEGFATTPDGFPLFYQVMGSGPDTVVALAGGPGLSFTYMARDLAPLAHGRTVIFYDPIGAGRSHLTLDPALLSLERAVQDVDVIRQHFGLGKVTLVGHSWGALVAARYAAQSPATTERLVLLDPAAVAAVPFGEQFTATRIGRLSPEALDRQLELIGLLLSGQAADPAAACEELFTNIFSVYFADGANQAKMSGRWCGESAASAAAAVPALLTGMASLGDSYDFRTTLLPSVQAPTLVVHGTADPVPFESSQAYAQTIPGARFLVLHQSGHFPWLEEPVEFFTQVNNFLRREDVTN